VYFSVQLYFNPQFGLFKFSSLFISEALEGALFSKKKQKKEVMKSKSMILEAQCRGLPEKTKNSAKSRRKGREEGLKGGRSASKAARKTTVRQEGGESLSS
jgi:hypothetical protein